MSQLPYKTENAKEDIKKLLNLMKIDKVIFVDDSLDSEPNVDDFKGLIRSIDSIDKLPAMAKQLPFFEFKNDLEIFIDEIDNKWEAIASLDKNICFEVTYKILERKEEYTNINVASSLKDFFDEGMLQLFNPIQWETYFGSFETGKEKLLVLFDQDLSKAGDKFATIGGKELILDIKKRGFRVDIYPALFTFTIQELEEELEERTKILNDFRERKESILSEDFFVFTKVRLNKPHLFVDAIKKLFLNEYCERIKNQTIAIAKKAYTKTFKELDTLDTYAFDFAVLKSSLNEGIWEVETLLRIINIYYEDFIKEQMIQSNYLVNTNSDLENAHKISNCVTITLGDSINSSPYSKPVQLREKEIYESGMTINSLHKPIENGDIFEITNSNGKKDNYILVAQECDLMLRSDGKRKLNAGTLLYISNSTVGKLLKEEEKDFKTAIEKHKTFVFWDTRYKLDHFDKDKIGVIKFTHSPLTIDMNFIDIIAFNKLGIAEIDIKSVVNTSLPSSLKKRESMVRSNIVARKDEIDTLLKGMVKSRDKYKNLYSKICPNFVMIGDKNIPAIITNKSVSFEVKRIKRLRQPYARLVLEKYMSYLTRNAEVHDFAKK